jgi:hypothetical protein
VANCCVVMAGAPLSLLRFGGSGRFLFGLRDIHIRACAMGWPGCQDALVVVAIEHAVDPQSSSVVAFVDVDGTEG